MQLINQLLYFVLLTSKKYNIDESHGLTHSINVLHFANELFEYEKVLYPRITNHDKIIYVSAALHDMCDKKYLDVNDGINEIEDFLQDKLVPNEINIVKQIITTMSYSKVKVDGFPHLGQFQNAYNIVREADLLAAYDFDRCIVYGMHIKGSSIDVAYDEAYRLFHNRVFRHEEDGLLTSDYSKAKHNILKNRALERMHSWRKMLHKNM
uniref:HD domain-containing protein n=1 Tax=viral metagenome TaxID=1070528 RepID=A0A6C0DSF1_9ZZZZ